MWKALLAYMEERQLQQQDHHLGNLLRGAELTMGETDQVEEWSSRAVIFLKIREKDFNDVKKLFEQKLPQDDYERVLF